jgi:hypothetical protein
MEKIVVISTNNNPDYFFYVPITTWAWQKLGWKVALFYTHDYEINLLKDVVPDYLMKIPEIEGVRESTQAQTARHFSANMLPSDSYVLLSDIDMIPLSNYINPELDKKTIWGWDLTGYSYVPVSYIGMPCKEWKELMGCTGNMHNDMENAMKENGRAYSDDWETYWNTDWDILTKKVQPRKGEFISIDRGMVNLAKDATAARRVDRYDMDKTMNQNDLIDCHAHNHNPSHPIKFEPLLKVLLKAFGMYPIWFKEYANTHHILYGQ